MYTWSAKVHTDQQNAEERWFKWLWTWQVCWCWMGNLAISNYWWGLVLPQCTPSCNGYFQQDNVPCHKAKINSNWFLEHFSTGTRSQSKRAPLGCVGTGDSHHGCAANIFAANVQTDAIMSIWTEISVTLPSMPQRIMAVLKILAS